MVMRPVLSFPEQGRQDRAEMSLPLPAETSRESLCKATLEIILPLCFCVIYIMSFYGPNQETSKLVQNETSSGMISTLGKIGALMILDVARI